MNKHSKFPSIVFPIRDRNHGEAFLKENGATVVQDDNITRPGVQSYRVYQLPDWSLFEEWRNERDFYHLQPGSIICLVEV